MSPTLRSSARRARTLPWEMLSYIYSFCDVETLAMLSLVSLGSWELASPLLYETVEITSFSALESLFFMESVSASARLAPAIPVLARIKTLSIDIERVMAHGTARASYDSLCHAIDENLWPVEGFAPHRLEGSFPGPAQFSLQVLKLQVRTREDAPKNTLALLSELLLAHLNPRTVVLFDRETSANRPTWTRPISTGQGFGSSVDLQFLSRWKALETVYFRGIHLVVSESSSTSPGTFLFSFWRPDRGSMLAPKPRKLRVVLDYASAFDEYVQAFSFPFGLEYHLAWAGLTKDTESFFAPVLRVKKVDEAAVQKDVAELEEWMKKLVVVETV